MTYRDAARGGPSHGHRWTSAFVRVVRGDGKDRTCISGDMLADRQTDRRRTDTVIGPYRGRSNNSNIRIFLYNFGNGNFRQFVH